MLEHLGQLVQRPSGMSFFRDFETPSLGFLAKLVLEERGGGVTAGSTVSKPNDFFVNDVVPISLFCLVTTPSFYLLAWVRATVQTATSDAPAFSSSWAQ